VSGQSSSSCPQLLLSKVAGVRRPGMGHQADFRAHLGAIPHQQAEGFQPFELPAEEPQRLGGLKRATQAEPADQRAERFGRQRGKHRPRGSRVTGVRGSRQRRWHARESVLSVARTGEEGEEGCWIPIRQTGKQDAPAHGSAIRRNPMVPSSGRSMGVDAPSAVTLRSGWNRFFKSGLHSTVWTTPGVLGQRRRRKSGFRASGRGWR